MSVDLHTHTSRSDGLLLPSELVRQAAAAGLTCLAVTDHDSVAGLDEAEAAGHELGVDVIAGVELSVRDVDPTSGEQSDDHLLGFFVDPRAPGLLRYLDDLQAGRQAMAQATIVRLAELGVPVDAARVAELARDAVVTRPHIARAMVEAGHVASDGEAFDRYLGSGKPGAVERPSPDPATAIAAIRAAGGVAGMAHPVFGQNADWAARLANLPARLDRLCAAGLAAMECLYPDATPEITDRLLALARERALIITGGSDFHGPGKAPFAPLGHVTVALAVVEALQAARP